MDDQPRRPFFTVDSPMRYTLAMAVLFVLPIVNTWLRYGGTITDEDVTLSGIASLVLVNPVAILVAGAVYTWRHEFSWLLPWLIGLAFVPAALLVYNDTALPFALVYAAVAHLGEGLGILARRLRRR